MQEQSDNPASPSPGRPEAAAPIFTAPREASRKNIFHRRVTALFASTFAAFSLTTWLLTRTNFSGDAAHDVEHARRRSAAATRRAGAERAANCLRAFFAAVSRRSSFAAFERMVSTHGGMFRATRLPIEDIAKSIPATKCACALAPADGQHYMAHYSTVLIEGRWWIDAMRWRGDEAPPERVFTRSATRRRNFELASCDVVVAAVAREIDSADDGA